MYAGPSIRVNGGCTPAAGSFMCPFLVGKREVTREVFSGACVCTEALLAASFSRPEKGREKDPRLWALELAEVVVESGNNMKCLGVEIGVGAHAMISYYGPYRNAPPLLNKATTR